jgi:ribosome maturation factor RimP
MSQDLTQALTEIAQRVANELGLDFYWLTLRRGGSRSVVTVYIDKPGGVSVDDCARVSRTLEEPYDALIERSYDLEVSSPGLDRELYIPAHYRSALGETVQLKLATPLNRQSVLTGQLQGLSENEVILDLPKEHTIHIPFAQIQRAKVIASL